MKPAANTQLISPIEAHCKQYKQLIAMGGPEPADYPKLEKFLESVYLLYQSGVYTDADIHRLNLQMPREGMENTLTQSRKDNSKRTLPILIPQQVCN